VTLNRREVLVFSAAASATGMIGAGPAFAAEGDQHDEAKLMQPDGVADRFIGGADAAVTVIEYASPTCSHCAAFHINTFPRLKETYIDTNKIKFILRPFVRNVLDAVVFLVAEAAGKEAGGEEAYHAIIDAYFKTQAQWAQAQRPRDALLEIALQHGFTEESFDAALTNQVLFEGMETLREQATNEFDLSGTPTFYINGKQLSGDKSFDQLAAEIDPRLG